MPQAGAPGSGGDGAGPGAGGDSGAGGDGGVPGSSGAGGEGEAGLVLVPGFSERKRLRGASNRDVALEEQLTGFASLTLPPTRLRTLTGKERTWLAPEDTYISDFCLHPSGEVSAIVVSVAHVISVVRLRAKLSLLGASELHDPGVAGDPHAAAAGVTDLLGNSLAQDPARIGANGEKSFAVVVSSINAVIGYRLTFVAGAWSAPERTLLEPPVALAPLLPIGGSFDTFGALTAWFRAPLDVDEDGNAYVVTWANSKRIHEHVALFDDGLTPLPGDPQAPIGGDSDLLLTKVDPAGQRLWSRVVGSEHEDEPYAIRARGGAGAGVGRSRRFPGFDNTVWDALVSVSTANGDLEGSVTLPLDASSILLGVDARPGGGWVVAGSDGWSQNPDGLSVLSFGQKLLLELPTLDATPIRRSIAAGPRHNELHSVIATSDGLWFAGHEDGPIMHTGDADASEIHATGVFGFSAN